MSFGRGVQCGLPTSTVEFTKEKGLRGGNGVGNQGLSMGNKF